ncbi:MAG TPA: helix-turn-helix transcriptional regulator, partial [Micromonosporaceae bacterium]
HALARTAARLTLAEAGRRAGYSAATLSRLETGRRQLSDVHLLRHLAHVFDIPPQLFGLATRSAATRRHGAVATTVGTDDDPRGGHDPVRRRDLLTGLAGLPVAATIGPPAGSANQPATILVTQLEDLLLRHRTPAGGPPADLRELRQRLGAARANFQASRYRHLARTLPQLLVDTTTTTTGGDFAALLAEVYSTVAHVLIKLEVPGLAWVATDRAMAAAGGDPVATASVTRNVVSLCRRDRRYDRAQQLALHAADRLTITGLNPDPTHLSLYGMLLCNAGYAAAQAGDRKRVTELLDHAAHAAALLGGDRNEHWTWFGPTNVTLHRISAAYALGDAGSAIDHAASVPRTALALPERQSRYWVDVARAYHQWGKPAKCYEALTIAERCAPEEVRARPAVQALTLKLLFSPRAAAMRGLPAFAARVGVPA